MVVQNWGALPKGTHLFQLFQGLWDFLTFFQYKNRWQNLRHLRSIISGKYVTPVAIDLLSPLWLVPLTFEYSWKNSSMEDIILVKPFYIVVLTDKIRQAHDCLGKHAVRITQRHWTILGLQVSLCFRKCRVLNSPAKKIQQTKAAHNIVHVTLCGPESAPCTYEALPANLHSHSQPQFSHRQSAWSLKRFRTKRIPDTVHPWSLLKSNVRYANSVFERRTFFKRPTDEHAYLP